MGCGGSKAENSPLVSLCRERKDFLKAASEQRYALASAHLAYFHSLTDMARSLSKLADQDLIASASASASASSSPVLTLPSDHPKPSSSSTSISISHGLDPHHSHFDLSSGSDSDASHIHFHDHDPELEDEHDDGDERGVEEDPPPSSSPSPYAYQPQDWAHNTYAYYMKRSAPPGKSMLYEEPHTHVARSAHWPDSPHPNAYGYGPPAGAGAGAAAYGNDAFFGFPVGSPGDYPLYSQPGPSSLAASPTPPPPAPPSPPRVSAWDFFNVFDSYDGYQPGYLSGGYGFGSTTSSPDSKEVREREGIPELEDETENEVMKEVIHKNKELGEEKSQKEHHKDTDFGEGTSNSKTVPPQQQSSSEGSSKTVRFHSSDDGSMSAHDKEIKSSPDTVVSNISPEEQARKKGVSFEVEQVPFATMVDGESSKLSSITTLSAHGTRDIREVVHEITHEFETASNYGKEVALLLEVYKPPYRSKVAAFKVIYSRILDMVAPSRLPSRAPSRPSVQLSSRAMKMAKAYCGEPGKDFKMNPENLSSTLEKLYAWEKKLYKEVKDEERLRAIYEKQCKRLKALDDRGAESDKVDATQASIRKLLTKINICIRTVETISGRIHKLRDDELQPQLAALINGLIRMWKFMLKCHQKQFQAIMESKTQSLKINTGLQRDEGLKAILELEKELLNWCSQFNNWVKTQKSYVENLNGWLIRCLPNEPEETADGIAPFSPSRIGAPPVFIICNDWHQAMARISERGVANAMHEFAQKLHELWERQDEEQRQRIKAEYLTRDFEKQLRTLRTEMGGLEHDHDKVSDKAAMSKAPSGSGVSPLDDLKVDLDSMRKRLHEERTKHREAIKLVRDAASNSLQAGLIPIFKTLENFTSEVVKAHEQVRLQNAGES